MHILKFRNLIRVTVKHNQTIIILHTEKFIRAGKVEKSIFNTHMNIKELVVLNSYNIYPTNPGKILIIAKVKLTI